MVSYNQLLNATGSKHHDVTDAWGEWAAAAHGQARDLRSIHVRTSWEGLASSEAHTFVGKVHSRLTESGEGLSRVQKCLDAAYQKFADAHNKLVNAQHAAEMFGFSVTNGRVIGDSKRVAALNGTTTADVEAKRRNWQKDIKAAIKEATDADKATHSALLGLMPPKDGGPTNSGGGGGPTGSPAAPIDYARSGNIPVPPHALDNVTNPKAKAALSYALKQLGKPYIWGGTGPSGYDCSGLTSQAYAAAGIHIPRTADVQWQQEPKVDNGHEQPGDLVFFHMGRTGPEHVGIVLDPHKGTMVVAPHTGDHIKIQDYKHYPGLVGFARPGVASH